MSNYQHRLNLTSIESYEEIRERKQALKAEIDGLGKEITTSAKDIVVKGAKATLTTVAIAIVTKGMATYLKFRSKQEGGVVSRSGESTDSRDLPMEDSTRESKLHGILVYIDMLVKVVDSAKVLYSVIQRYRSADWEEE